jgi:phenylalanyl-tRNA synthetase beta chain
LSEDPASHGNTLLAFGSMGETGVVVGRVVEIRPHPCRELIWLSTVDTGTGRKPQIVWGGIAIVKAGSLVPVAQPGTWLPPTKDKPNPYKVRRRRYAGEISEGMLCSLAELGWDPAVTDWVALLNPSAGLSAGQPLENRYDDWRAIALHIDASRAKRLAGR